MRCIPGVVTVGASWSINVLLSARHGVVSRGELLAVTCAQLVLVLHLLQVAHLLHLGEVVQAVLRRLVVLLLLELPALNGIYTEAKLVRRGRVAVVVRSLPRDDFLCVAAADLRQLSKGLHSGAQLLLPVSGA